MKKRINIRNKEDILSMNELKKGTSIQIRASKDFIKTLHLFNEKITNGNELAKIRPLSSAELTSVLSPLIKERIIKDDNINVNIKKTRNKRKMKYYLELERAYE